MQSTKKTFPWSGNLETNLVIFNQQPINQSTGKQKGLWMHPNGDMKLQYMLPPNSSHGINIANREATMTNFNQNFHSRRPQGRMPSTISNFTFQISYVNPLLTGSFKGSHPNVLDATLLLVYHVCHFK